MDEKVAPADIPKQWQETRANRRTQFKVGNRDGSGESNIRLLTGTIKANRQKDAASWRITNAEKLQLSVFLPNELSLED